MASVGGLAVFDLDGTLVRGATTCELLAEPVGQVERMRMFERYQSLSELSVARAEMVEWYRPLSREKLLAALEHAQLAPGLREGFDLLRRHHIQIAIASLTWDFAVEWFARLFGVSYFLGTALSENGAIQHVWPADKAAWLQSLQRQLDVPAGRVAAIGDSTGDLEMLRAADWPIFVGASLPVALPHAVHLPSGDILEVSQRVVEVLAA